MVRTAPAAVAGRRPEGAGGPERRGRGMDLISRELYLVVYFW